ncbi:MAG: hypothetical protein A2408_00215 [Candidatus Yonathbacteria bacterium RIFOXYC1_FULL_52_10]|uniref:Uncharacterized protein n=1 Tax=Candidatus Yonathbacteria bacterium RIFOXYD1_FULL_52_36 TaxID=1802730 RepID=A0A1G2SL96_9BACT|nr:MAG: hypothetical protein A2408_00215 [Candidatus Yonathbacteria bacterium RIFOXYC1_FULL_52_10]OHA85807.1 MAG: hypothetical protein A2591_00480 [Candidatus Yonathbacteria bacterium RIFOXYD1_FULL_52_36]
MHALRNTKVFPSPTGFRKKITNACEASTRWRQHTEKKLAHLAGNILSKSPLVIWAYIAPFGLAVSALFVWLLADRFVRCFGAPAPIMPN